MPDSAAKTELVQGLLDTWDDQYKTWFANQSPAKLDRIQRRAQSLKHGMTVISPAKCWGPKKCPWFHSCPIPDDPAKPGPASDYPIGMACVLESQYTAQRVIDYVEDLQVDPANAVEMSLINELALLDLLKNRAILILSGGDRLGQGQDLLAVDEVITGWDEDGNPRMSRQTRVHPAMDILDKLEKRRGKILDKFMATRESKYKVFGGNQETNSRLQQDIEHIKRFIDTLGEKKLLVDSESDQPIRIDDDEL